MILIVCSGVSPGQTFTSVVSTNSVEADEYLNLLTPVNQNLYFVVSRTEWGGMSLWRTNVNQTNAILVRNFANISSLINYKGQLFFIADDGKSGNELWKTNGTFEGTILVKDIRPGVQGANADHLAMANGVLYFTALDGVHGRELWRSDGTNAGTALLKDISGGASSSHPAGLVNVNGTLFFSANDGKHGSELWKTDGSRAGTTLVRDIQTGSKVGSRPQSLARCNGLLIFSAIGTTTGRELWRSDGTTFGTVTVKDIRRGIGSSNPHLLTTVDSTIYFAADDGLHGLELWKSDGTAAGTTLVKDLTPGPGSDIQYATRHLSELTAINDKLYFLGVSPGPDSYESTQSLWVSDGTDAGTRRLTLFPEISFGFTTAYPTQFKGAAYFVAGSEQGVDLWRTKGTVRTTVRVIENVAEPHSLYAQLTKVSNYLYFVGHANLNRTDGTAAGTIVVSGIDATNEQEVILNGGLPVSDSIGVISMSAFPNPFEKEFDFRVTRGAVPSPPSLSILDSHGQKIESRAIIVGEGYRFGLNWPSGLYILEIRTGKGIVRRRIYKK